MNEQDATRQQVRFHAAEAKRNIEALLAIYGWTHDPALSQAIDRLVELKERGA